MPEPRRGIVLAVTGLPVFLVSLNLLVMAVAFPALEASFPHSRRAELSRVLNRPNIVFGSLLIPAGRAADRRWRRRVVAPGLVVFCVGPPCGRLSPGLPFPG